MAPKKARGGKAKVDKKVSRQVAAKPASKQSTHSRSTRSTSNANANANVVAGSSNAVNQRSRRHASMVDESQDSQQTAVAGIGGHGREAELVMEVSGPVPRSSRSEATSEEDLDYEDDMSEQTEANDSPQTSDGECSGPDNLNESGELSDQDGGIASGGNYGDDLESSDQEAERDPPRKRRKGISVERMMERMQQVVDKKGYLGPRELARLTRSLEGTPSKHSFEQSAKQPKRSAGGGDRYSDGEVTFRQGKGTSKVRPRVTFHSPLATDQPQATESEVTLYRTAVKNKIDANRASSSSEELALDFSGDSVLDMHNVVPEHDYSPPREHDTEPIDANSHEFVAAIRRHYDERRRGDDQPGPSGGRRERDRGNEYLGPARVDMTPPRGVSNTDDAAERIIREAEAHKARIYGTPGTLEPVEFSNKYVHSSMVDETYMLVGAHLDSSMVEKIVQGQFVDFSKLIPRDKLRDEAGPEYKLIIKAGRSHYVPVTEGTMINGYVRWEQAFRVFSDIYTRSHPKRAAELIQYNHIIHNISFNYVWDNVYKYDQEFRMHMSKHPNRSWAITLPMAWSFCLQDRIKGGAPEASYNQRGSGGRGRGRGEPCRIFNRGRCTYGGNCKYEHRCGYCFKFGHPAVNCRKAQSDRETGTNQRSNKPAVTNQNNDVKPESK